MDSLTGDPELDRLVPAASRLVYAVRLYDREEVAAALNDAAAALAGSPYVHEPGTALSIVLAAMVPWEERPGDLLWWVRRRPEYERLTEAGVDPAHAATLVERASPLHREGR